MTLTRAAAEASARADDETEDEVDARAEPGKPVLVTGATGYFGGRLVPRLLERGLRVRCLVRSDGSRAVPGQIPVERSPAGIPS